MMALILKSGVPKWNGVAMPIQRSLATAEKSTLPMHAAMMVPMIMPQRTDVRAIAGGAKRSTKSTIASVPRPRQTLVTEPRSLAPDPPEMLVAATGMSESPTQRITVPVTSGGKRKRRRAKTGASSIMKTPQEMTAP